MSQNGTSMGPNFILQKENSPHDGLIKSTKLHFWSTDLVLTKYSFGLVATGFRIVGLRITCRIVLGLYRRPKKDSDCPEPLLGLLNRPKSTYGTEELFALHIHPAVRT